MRRASNGSELFRVFELGCLLLFAGAAVGLFLVQSYTQPRTAALAPENSDPNLTAHAFCMPNQGWAPLQVYFSPFGSQDLDGRIVRYEWDLDGDGRFETDATSNGGYTDYTYLSPGSETIALRVTDDAGHTSTASVQIEVRHPASSSVDYWSVFDDRRVRRVDLRVSQANWDLLWADPGAKVEVEADAVVFGERLERIGLSMRGNFSLLHSNEKKPWRIDTDAYVDGQEFHNLRQLLFVNNLGDPTLVREKLAYEMLAFAGVPASHVCFVEIWVDLTDDDAGPTFLGVYTMVERVDMKYVANRFGQDNTGGNLYKANHFVRGPADLVYYGEDFSQYPMPHGLPVYGKVNNEEQNDYSDIVRLCRTIDGVTYATPDDFAAALEQVFNADGFLRYLAVEIALMSWDIYPNTGNNLYLYNNPGTGRFEWLPWDQTWGENVQHPLFGLPNDAFRLIERAPLFDRVMEVPRYRLAYAAYLDLLTRYWFTEDNVALQVQRYCDTIAPHLLAGSGDPMFFGPTAMMRSEDFERACAELPALVGRRSEFIQSTLMQEQDDWR